MAILLFYVGFYNLKKQIKANRKQIKAKKADTDTVTVTDNDNDTDIYYHFRSWNGNDKPPKQHIINNT